MNLAPAQRKNAKIRLGLLGTSRSGKTMTALKIAFGMTNDWTKIAVIDTENRSSELYSHLGPFQVLHLTEPFTPERYIEAINICQKANVEVVVIDSTTHEWQGAGGILETHGNMTGNSFTNWSTLTPRHQRFINAILKSSCHVICTVRSKTEYVLTDKNGKQVPEKVGMAGIQREGLEFELSLVLELNIKHQATATKDRTGLYMDKPNFIPDETTGRQILDWCNSGLSKEEVAKQIKRTGSIQTLKEIFNNNPEFQQLLSSEFTEQKKKLQAKETKNKKQAVEGPMV